MFLGEIRKILPKTRCFLPFRHLENGTGFREVKPAAYINASMTYNQLLLYLHLVWLFLYSLHVIDQIVVLSLLAFPVSVGCDRSNCSLIVPIIVSTYILGTGHYLWQGVAPKKNW